MGIRNQTVKLKGSTLFKASFHKFYLISIMEFNPEFNPMVLLTSVKEESDSKHKQEPEQNWGPILAFVLCTFNHCLYHHSLQTKTQVAKCIRRNLKKQAIEKCSFYIVKIV